MSTRGEESELPTSAIAIIGMAGEFPGAPTIDAFWELISEGRCALETFDRETLLARGVPVQQLDDPQYVPVGTFLPQLAEFDAAFFGFTPREAETMDPQVRRFFQLAWHAAEDAGYHPLALPPLTGIFAGSRLSGYLFSNLVPNTALRALVGDLALGIGNERDALPMLLAYKLNLTGPAVNVQSFCSTSLVAVHLACQSLLSFESDMALAGGVAFQVPHGQGYLYQEGGILAPDGVVRSLDAQGRGSVMGDGAGVVVLKRLEDAIDDGDPIIAVIRGTAVNNDGRQRAGYTAPGLNGQAAVIAEALGNADVPVESISYLETHGTGTPLGDSIELRAMTLAFQTKTDRTGFCAIGSLKPNIGHLDRAAGVANLIKVALSLSHRQLPPSINFATPHPDVALENSPFVVNTALRSWDVASGPRRAGVSSFGLGGTNSHVIVEEAPLCEPGDVVAGPVLLVVSAQLPEGVGQVCAALARVLEVGDLVLADVAYTLQVGRGSYAYRVAFCVEDRDAAVAALRGVAAPSGPVVGLRAAGLWVAADAGAAAMAFVASEPALTAALAGVGADVRAATGQTPMALLAGGGVAATVLLGVVVGRVLRAWGVPLEVITGVGAGEHAAAVLRDEVPLVEALRMAGAVPAQAAPDAQAEGPLWVQVGREGVVVDGVAVGGGMLGVVGELWVRGVPIAWAERYREERRLRVHLPGYPFAPTRWWVDAPTEVVAPVQRASGRYADPADWFYLPIWKPLPIWRPADVPAAAVGLHVIFADEYGVGADLAAAWRRQGVTVVCVLPDAQFARVDADMFRIDPALVDDYQRLIRNLPSVPVKIVHMWSLNAVPGGEDEGAAFFDRAQVLGFNSLIFLMQALNHVHDSIVLSVIGSGALAVSGQEPLYPERAAIRGLCRVIGQERLNVTCGYVDVVWPPEQMWQRGWLVEQLRADLDHGVGSMPLAYRGVQRWEQGFEQVSVPAPEFPPFRVGGVYVITGGLGGIGVVLARHLAQVAQARVALIGRSSFPPRDAWEQWVADHAEADAVRQKVVMLLEVERLGGKVAVFQADAADPAAMGAAIAQVVQMFGPLNGVIHAAGTSRPECYAPVQEMELWQSQAHFQPKAHSLYALEQALDGHVLDFCVLFSSLSSVLGGLAFGAYTAANTVVDVFTHRHNRRSPQWWTAVNWDTWTVHADAHDRFGATLTQFEMRPDEGARALERVVAGPVYAQIVNSTGDLEARIDQWVRKLGGGSALPDSGARHERPAMLGPYEPPSNETEERITAIWEAIIGVQPIGVHDNFIDLGGHSLMATQVVSRLRQAFLVNIPLQILLVDAPTVAELAIAVELAIIDELKQGVSA